MISNSKSVVLALDTSSPLLELSAVGGGGGIVSLRGKNRETHHEELLALTEKALHSVGAKAEQLSNVIVASGPGSFTGLRIGLSFAKGLCQATGASLVMVPSFPAYALSAQGAGKAERWVLGDARRREAYFAVYSSTDVLRELVAPTILSFSDVARRFEESLEQPSVLTADREFAASLGAEFPGLSGALAQVEGASKAMLELWRRCPQSGFFSVFSGADSVSLSETTPLYLREAAAKTIAERQKAS